MHITLTLNIFLLGERRQIAFISIKSILHNSALEEGS